IVVQDEAGVVAPSILSVPERTVAAGQPYRYDDDSRPAARGDRPLAWSLGKRVGNQLEGAPDGMRVDPATGEVVWTPTAGQIGTVSVVLAASNAAGTDLQEWEIEITGERPAVPV